MTTDREKFIARYQQKGQDANSFYKEDIDNHIQHGRLKTGLLTLLGGVMVVAGNRLVKKSADRQKRQNMKQLFGNVTWEGPEGI